MHDMESTLERPCDAGTPVTVARADGSEVTVRLRLLGYDGCEFESDEGFAAGERVAVHLYRMGRMRARVISSEARIVEAAFDLDCPV